MKGPNVMNDITDFKDLIGKRVTGIQNRHDAITIETEDGQWKALQSGQAGIHGKYPIGLEITDVRETRRSENVTEYQLKTSAGDFVIRSQQ
jgi:hypothetical protein